MRNRARACPPTGGIQESRFKIQSLPDHLREPKLARPLAGVKTCPHAGRKEGKVMIIFTLAVLIFMNLMSSGFASGHHQTFINRQQWEKAAKAYDYTETYKDKKPKKTSNVVKNPAASFFSRNIGEIKYLIGGFIILLLIALIIWLILSSYNEMGLKIKDNKNLLNQPIENIELADLENMLKQAIASGSFKEAVRVRYLMLLRTLSKLRLVIWQKDKTNGAYIHEMYGKNGFELFLKLTINFERIWYGEQAIDENDYHNLIPFFEQIDNIFTTRE
jgi:hypothetical protein